MRRGSLRQARNYSAGRHLSERVLSAVSGRGWPARIAYALGFQRRLGTTEHVVESARFPATAPPLKIAFAADFHAGPATHPRLLEATCRALAAAEPDLLLLGGDFVCYRAAYAEPIARLLGEVPARLGRYAVLGNHDHWAGAREITTLLEQAGIGVLTNRNVRLPAPYDAVRVCGIDDHGSGWPDAGAAFAGADGLRIVLIHSPSGLLDIGDRCFDLSLSGHTHGGQIALPGGFAPFVPQGALCRQFVYGRYPLNRAGNESVAIVSRGIGCSALPIRLFADPEIVVCTVRGETSAQCEDGAHPGGSHGRP